MSAISAWSRRAVGDVAEVAQFVALTPGRKFSGRARVGFPRVRVADVGGEEFDEALADGGVRREERRKRCGTSDYQLCHSKTFPASNS
jgi:hypothetical protein